MKYRLGMLAAAFMLTATTAFAQAWTPVLNPIPGWTPLDYEVTWNQPDATTNFGQIAMKTARIAIAPELSRDAWLKADAANCTSWNVWANPFGQWGRQKVEKVTVYNIEDNEDILWARDAYTEGYDVDVYGLAIGIDKNFGANLKIGLFGQYADGDMDARTKEWNGVAWDSDRFKFADLDMWSFGGYAMYKYCNWFAVAKTSYLYNQYDATRGAWDMDNDTDAKGWAGSLTLGYQFTLGCDWEITPTVGIDYIYLKTDGYTAWSNAGFGRYAYADNRQTSLELPVMVKIAKSFATSFGSVTPFVRGGWIHEFHDKANRSSATAYNVAGDVVERVNNRSGDRASDLGQVGIGVDANINGRADLFAAWDYQWGKKYHQNQFNIGFGLNF